MRPRPVTLSIDLVCDPRSLPGTPLAADWAPTVPEESYDSLGEWEWWSIAAIRALARGQVESAQSAATRAASARRAFLLG